MAEPVAITGLGCVGAPGAGCTAQLAALLAGRNGLATAVDPALPLAAHLPVGRYTGPLPPSGRTSALGQLAAAEALADADLAPGRRRPVGVVSGTSTGGMRESEAAWLASGGEGPLPPAYHGQPVHRLTRDLAAATGCHGPSATHAVACASAACALVEACEWIRCGRCGQVLVVGADANARLTLAGFHALRIVDPAGCRPLTEERAGMSLGEGAAALVLEQPALARARGARLRGALLGWGIRADAYHQTAPDPTGRQLDRAIADALADAGLAAVDLVNVHGTGTRDNDAVESTVLAERFGRIPAHSLKQVYGHTMGAAAAVEAVAALLAIESGTAFASAGAEDGTPLAALDVVTRARDSRPRTVLSTSLAFGGVNAALVFGGSERCA